MIEPEAKHKKLVALLNIILEDLRDRSFRGDGYAASKDQTCREMMDMRDWLEACDTLSQDGPEITSEQASEIFGALAGSKDYLSGKNRAKFWELCKEKIRKILAGEIEHIEAGGRYIAPVQPEGHEMGTPDASLRLINTGQINKIERVIAYYGKNDDAKLAELQQIAMRWWEKKDFRQVVKELAAFLQVSQRELLSHSHEITPENEPPPEPEKIIKFPERKVL